MSGGFAGGLARGLGSGMRLGMDVGDAARKKQKDEWDLGSKFMTLAADAYDAGDMESAKSLVEQGNNYWPNKVALQAAVSPMRDGNSALEMQVVDEQTGKPKGGMVITSGDQLRKAANLFGGSAQQKMWQAEQDQSWQRQKFGAQQAAAERKEAAVQGRSDRSHAVDVAKFKHQQRKDLKKDGSPHKPKDYLAAADKIIKAYGDYVDPNTGMPSTLTPQQVSKIRTAVGSAPPELKKKYSPEQLAELAVMKVTGGGG